MQRKTELSNGVSKMLAFVRNNKFFRGVVATAKSVYLNEVAKLDLIYCVTVDGDYLII